MTAEGLTVGRGVVMEMVRLAAEEVPGVLRVGRAGPAWRGWGRPRVVVRRRADQVEVKLWVVARPGQPLVALGREIRAAVAATIDQLLGLEPAGVTVVIDGVGG